jgi:hypothetical protein
MAPLSSSRFISAGKSLTRAALRKEPIMSITTDKDIEKGIEVREPAITILDAELAVSSSERVLSWLQIRAKSAHNSTPEFDAQVEATLLARQDPLINLGLAQYGIEDRTLKTLFDSADPVHRTAVRLAVLSNEAIQKHQAYHTGNLIEALIGYKANVGEWLATLSNEELRALFKNPRLSDDFLIDFLAQKKGWNELDERKQLFVLKTLAQNPRLSARYKSIIMNGYAEYKHGAVFSAAWDLAKSAPVKIQWCWVLSELWSHTAPSSSIEAPLEVAKRWFPDPADERVSEAEQKSIESGYLGAFGQVRSQLARIAVDKSASGAKLDNLLTHEDLPVRLAACRYGNLTADQIQAAVVRDPKFVFDQVVRNEALWRRLPTRETLKALAWEQPDPGSHMDAPNMYKYMEAEFRQKYPQWFEGEDEEAVDADTLPVTQGEFKEAVADISRKIELTYPTLGTIQSSSLTVLARSGWLWWGLAVVLGISILELLIRVFR